jgi:phosphate transport system substrate-binding protein
MMTLKAMSPPLKKKPLQTVVILAALAAFFIPGKAEARDQIHIVGSSTVYPFVTAVAEEFSRNTNHPGPLVEATGTGGGIKLFCGGVGEKFPDIVNASRQIKDSEKELCKTNGVNGITEIKIGFDGIVLANSKKAPLYNLTKEQIFKALAKQLPDASGKLVGNTNMKWSDIDPAFPGVKIEVYGPPATSGTRDAFVEMVMEKSCVDLPAFKTAYADESARKKACMMMREDGHYIEAGENDNLIVQKLENNPDALGIFGFSFLDQHKNTLQGSMVGGEKPTFDAIASGKYGISRALYVYVKNQHLATVGGIGEFVQELVSNQAVGANGYLIDKGLIILPQAELAAMQKVAAGLTSQAKAN